MANAYNKAVSMRYLTRLRRERWSGADFPQLPLPTDEIDPEHRDYLLLASGLTRLLARCTPAGAERQFDASLRAYRALRVQVHHGVARLPAEILNDLSHEIAMYTDRAMLRAALRCLQRQAFQRAAYRTA